MHPLLARQLRQAFASGESPGALDRLVRAVDEAYKAFDDERHMMDRSMSLASEELVAVNERLKIDLDRRLRAEEALRRSEERYALALRGSNDGLFDWDCATNRVFLSDRWYGMLGLSRDSDDAELNLWLDRVHADDLPQLKESFEKLRASDYHVECEHRLRHEDGSWSWVLMRACSVRSGDGRLSRVAGSLSDITARKRAELQVTYAAHHDALTGLANRAMLLEKLSEALDRSASWPRRDFAILFMDMDRFKFVNDSLGHLVGDALLIQTATRIRSVLRAGDTLARLGGDEFVVLLPDAATPADATATADRILQALRAPFSIDGSELFVSISIGIALSDANYADAHAMLRDADTALYEAKGEGPGRHRLFDSAMRHQAVQSLQLDSDLRHAIERREFQMVYQPIVDLATFRLTGFESLIRWRHPERGLISPAEFIPIAEQNGLMVPLGEWVLDETCRQRAEWNTRYPNLADLTVAVNLSAVQFAHEGLADTLQSAIQKHQLKPAQLVLEMTESAVMSRAEQVSATFEKLRGIGVKLSIDDFGTGYSSLSCLHRFPFDFLKIDRSFVSRLDTTADAMDIIQTIVALGHRMKLKVIAEGMETRAQLEGVVLAGCDRAQGYIFSRPLQTPAIEPLLARPLFELPSSQQARAG